MRIAPAWLFAAMLVTSSPISAAGSPPQEGLPESKTVSNKTDVTPADPAKIRELVEGGELSKALEQVRSALARGLEPSEAASLRLVEARLLERLGKSWDSIQVYRDLLERPEAGDVARRELHALYVRRGQFRAADYLTAAPDTGRPVTPELVRLRAYAASVQGDFEAAASLLEPLAGPGDPAASVLRANTLLALGRRDEARRLYTEVLSASAPAGVLQAAHYGLGQLARLAGGRAIRALEDEKAARLGPMAAAELDRGLALRALGRRDEARAQLEAVVKAWPALASTARLSLARLDEDQGRTETALERLAAAIEGSTTDLLPLTRLGDLLRERGDEDAAVEQYRAALEIFPDFPLARHRLADALASQGRWEEFPPPTIVPPDSMGMVWERLLDGDLPYHEVVADRSASSPDDPRRVVLALVELKAGNPAGAIAWTEGGAGKPILELLRAEGLERAGRPDEAVERWEIVLSRTECSLAREGLVRVAAAEGERDRAVEAWEQLFRAHPHVPRAMARLAAVFERAGWKREAKESWDRALTSGYLTPDERRFAREAAEDLADEIAEEEETREEGVEVRSPRGPEGGPRSGPPGGRPRD